jgi:tetratricopeptide (TPR) repeat protein
MKNLFSLVSFIFFASVVLAEESHFDLELQRGKQHLASWQVSQASQAAERIFKLAESPEDRAQSYFFESQVEFHKSNYIRARELGEKARALLPLEEEIQRFLDYVSRVAKNAERFKEVKTEHFMIRYAHSKDSILLDYAEGVLERVYYEIGLDLESYPSEPVVVEIYPDAESFTLASTLSEQDIMTTGVVGICKFNRIMILSPRLLPQGYMWLDTLAHEYAHYLIFLKSANTVPVWLHEGIAKFEEKRWKEKRGSVMNPFYETLLAKALKENNLVPIEKMHPSLGKLSSAYEAQLAFAQVGTIVDFLVKKWGNTSLVNLLNSMREKKDYTVAIREITKRNFADFYDSWVTYLRSKNLRERIPQIKVKELKIEKGTAKSKDPSADLLELDDARAKNYTRLGDMLRSRGRLRAASYEYEKALDFDPLSPIILNRLASTLSAYGEYDKAREKLTPVVELHPEYIESYTNLGKIHWEKGNFNKAKEAYTQAVSINPFNPEIHAALISIYKKLGQPDLEESEKKILSTLLKEDTN